MLCCRAGLFGGKCLRKFDVWLLTGGSVSRRGLVQKIVAVLTCALVAGCGTDGGIEEPSSGAESGSNTIDSGTAAASEPQSFKFESGELKIGDFDPYTLGDDLFDPCTEISPEEFAAAGFENVEPIEEEYRGLNTGLNACFFDEHPEIAIESFINSNASQEVIGQQTEILADYSSEILPDLFVYHPEPNHGDDCYAQVDTKRGGFVSAAGGLSQQSDELANCRVAIENLERLFQSSQEL